MLLVRNIRLPLTCPDPDAEAAAKALAILRVPLHGAYKIPSFKEPYLCF